MYTYTVEQANLVAEYCPSIVCITSLLTWLTRGIVLRSPTLEATEPYKRSPLNVLIEVVSDENHEIVPDSFDKTIS